MTVAALVMGRAGSKGAPKKNIRLVGGRPLVSYAFTAAIRADTIDAVFVSTDCPHIKAVAHEYGVRVIDRPEDLAGDTAQMSDVIVHAFDQIQSALPDTGILVTMHANCGIHRHGLIDECVSGLRENIALDSVVSARVVEDLHPFRLKKVGEDGLLTPWVDTPEGVTNNRQGIRPQAVVLDGACRAFRVPQCLDMAGQPPFRYLGQRIGWVENPHGRDVHNELDLAMTEEWIAAQRVQESIRPVA